jgi:perosamine synthetase
MSAAFIPYGRQIVSDSDIDAVVDVLRSNWLTTGPAVDRFESGFAAFVQADHGVAVANGTAALHLCMLAAGIGPGDEVIVSSMTFAASANCVRYVGADVVFADVVEETMTIDPTHVESLITSKTKAIVAVDYAGVPADLGALMALATAHNLLLVEDACHAPGARYQEAMVGSIAHLTAFSFHPVKHITTGEGGMVTTNDEILANSLRRFRNHGIDTDFRQRENMGTWEYDMVALGFNYRLPDVSCALGTAQLGHLSEWIERRSEIARHYNKRFAQISSIRTITVPTDREASWHLFPVRLQGDNPQGMRASAFDFMRSNGIGVNVHYRPVYLHSYYRNLGYAPGLCPVAEREYEGLLSLPMWPGLDMRNQDRVVDLLLESLGQS